MKFVYFFVNLTYCVLYIFQDSVNYFVYFVFKKWGALLAYGPALVKDNNLGIGEGPIVCVPQPTT